MKRFCTFALTMAIVAVTTGRIAGGGPRAAEQRDPQQVFRKTCERLVALEAKHDLLKGVSEVKPVIERDEKGRLNEKLRPNQVPRVPAEQNQLLYNSLFKGMRLFLYNGLFEHKDQANQAGILNLYGSPELEAGVRYRLTWACWLVGASEAVEVSCEFELGK
jgi:hypothetical protein